MAEPKSSVYLPAAQRAKNRKLQRQIFDAKTGRMSNPDLANAASGVLETFPGGSVNPMRLPTKPTPVLVTRRKGQLPQVVNPAGGLRGSSVKPVGTARPAPKPSAKPAGSSKPAAKARSVSVAGPGGSGGSGGSNTTANTAGTKPAGPNGFFSTPAQARSARVPGLTLKFKKGAGYYWGSKNNALDPPVATAVDARSSGKSGGAGGGNAGSSPAKLAKADPLQELVDFFKRQRQQMLSTQTDQQNALSGFTKQLMDYLTGIPGQVETDYNNAISQSDRLAQSASTAFANLNPNSTTQSYLSGIGASGAQQAQNTIQNQNVFGGGAASLYTNSGVVPGQDLAGQKAAQLAFTRQLPDVQALAARQAMKNLLYGQGQELNKFDSSVAENMLMYKQKQQELAQQKLYNDQRIALAQNADITKTAVATDKSKQAWARLKQQGDIAAANLEARVASLGETARHNNAMETLSYDRIQSGLKKSAKKGLSALQITKMKGSAARIAKNAYFGAVNPTTGEEVKEVDYQTALGLMRESGVNLATATSALNYYYKPGERKRPYLSFQTRQTLTRMGVPQDIINVGMWDPQAASQAIAVAKKKAGKR